jgi:hypothetical protein
MSNEIHGTDRKTFKVRFQEHLRDIKYNNNKSKFAQHLIDTKHPTGTMEVMKDVIHITRKGRMMNAQESFHIYKETKNNNQINDKLTVRENAIFETTVQEDPYRWHATPAQHNS